MGTRGTLIALTTATFLLGACAHDDLGAAPGSTGSDPVAASFSALPAASDCGAADLPLGSTAPTLPASAVDCLKGHVSAGRTAAVAVTTRTTEGDPVVRHYRIPPTGAIDVWTDATKDTFGSKRWGRSTLTCPASGQGVEAQLCGLRA